MATEQVRHANLVSFTCLKALAFAQRFERKDAHDLIYCIDHAPEGLDAVSEAFRQARDSEHGDVIDLTLEVFHRCFVGDDRIEGHRKDGPVAVARFELGEEARLLRQRQVTEVIEELLARIG